MLLGKLIVSIDLQYVAATHTQEWQLVSRFDHRGLGTHSVTGQALW